MNPLWNRVYSPYQLLEIGQSDDTGLMLIRAAGHYYQRVYDLSASDLDPQLKKVRGENCSRKICANVSQLG